MEIKLTKNFTLEEMCKSVTAKKLRIRNVPSPDCIKNLQALCENVLQPLRDGLCEPVIINSGYRCSKLNQVVGGTSSSQHLKGEAADIRCRDFLYAKKIYTWIMDNCEFDQLILETKGKSMWVHVSYTTSGKNRQQALTIHNA